MLLLEGGVDCKTLEQAEGVPGPGKDDETGQPLPGGVERARVARVSIDMMAGEHLLPCYLVLNPRHDVPLLRICLGAGHVQDASEDGGEARTGDIPRNSKERRVCGGAEDLGGEGGNGWSLTETHAIMRFLCESESCLSAWYPGSIRLRARVDEYLDWHIANIRHPTTQVV